MVEKILTVAVKIEGENSTILIRREREICEKIEGSPEGLKSFYFTGINRYEHELNKLKEPYVIANDIFNKYRIIK